MTQESKTFAWAIALYVATILIAGSWAGIIAAMVTRHHPVVLEIHTQNAPRCQST